MAFKFIAFATLLALANAGFLPEAPLPYAHLSHGVVPIAKTVVAKTIDAEHDPHPQYSYSYDVHDTLTGDAKSQHESRDGDVVHGSYSLVEADGTRRIVEYTADPVNGFNAVVHKEPATVAVKAIAAAPVAVKTYAAAPVAHAAPLAYATPVAHASTLAYSAPVAKFAAPVAHVPTLAYTAPVAHASTYAYKAPVAKYAASPLTYTAPVSTYVH